MTDLKQAVETVKCAVRSQAVHICFPAPGVMAAIKAQDAARDEVAKLPKISVASYPYYQSVDDGQSGLILEAHLSADQLPSVPLHIVTEMLDELATCAGGVNDASPREYRRNQILTAYGPALAELVCQGLDEALESRSEGYKRLRDWDGNNYAPLSSTEMDEPLYEDCAATAEHASATTSFDFWDAIEGARELIETRDKAAAAARRGADQAA